MISFYLIWSSNSPLFSGLAHKSTWSRLQAESCALRERGMCQGTWANKVSHLRTYVTFTTFFRVPDFPVHLGVLLRFIAFLGRAPMAYNSVLNIVYSVKWFASLLDPPSVKLFDSVLVSVSLKGLRAQLSRPVRQKLPFTVIHLCKFFNYLNLSDVRHCRARVLCCLPSLGAFAFLT